jgi:predicted permease
MKTGISWLDVKLGARMLIKHPGLTLVGGLGMAVAIAIGAGSFAFFYSHLYPNLPLDEGDRIIAVENWNTRVNNEERHSTHDFVTWRRELTSVRDLAAFRSYYRNLIVPGGPAEVIRIADMTASGFSVARVRPLLGRHLVPDDERQGAAPVLVIGYEAWKTRFASDPRIVGRTVRLGNRVHTVVGVMPERFAFPMNFSYWTPLRIDPSAHERGKGPEMLVFGRLAPGVTRDEAQAELTTLGRRAAAAYPRTHARLRPQVLPYTYPLLDIQDVGLWSVSMMQFMVSMLLVVVAVNVAILVYARTATRLGEITVRSALGASRRRIVAQLFAEALVLSAAAAVVGLGVAQLVLRMANRIMEDETVGAPFWIDYGLSPATVVYVLGLTLLSAVIVGVLPALQATGKRLQSSLRQLGGGTGMRLGRTWTVLIVAQVGFAVAALPMAVAMGWNEVRNVGTRPTFAAGDYISGYMVMDQDAAGMDPAASQRAHAARFAAHRAEIERRLQAEPAVTAVTFSSGVPGGEPTAQVEIEGVPTPEGARGHETGFNRVDPGFFDVLGAPVLTGRRFAAADLDTASSAVVVNRSFVRQHLGGGNALGRRVRYVTTDDDGETGGSVGRWYEIVGVVDDLHTNSLEPDLALARLYHPLVPGAASAGLLTARVRGSTPAEFGARLREITTSLDPTLRVGEVRTLDDIDRQGKQALRLIALVLTMVTLSVLLLSAAGIYALMSFTVLQRRKEIGIRAALGAHPRRLLGSIFSRALAQLALGLGVGLGAAALLDLTTGGELMAGKGPLLLPLVAALMFVVGLLAALGPARRGLRIQPSEALRAEG